jgi:hypothetical protein
MQNAAGATQSAVLVAFFAILFGCKYLMYAGTCKRERVLRRNNAYNAISSHLRLYIREGRSALRRRVVPADADTESYAPSNKGAIENRNRTGVFLC